ncbi:MAG: hypothetical protein JWO02_2921 [Solirubrobacterales bacterium]|nr:hypothetical protein [Solirubrobacterales bacterium]
MAPLALGSCGKSRRAATPTPPATTRYVAKTGSDAGNACRSKATPCASFGAAYAAAQPGDRVQVAAGTYPTQRIDYDASKVSPDDVVIAPARGAVVRTGDLLIKARHLTVQGMAVDDVALNVNAEINDRSDITARDVTLREIDGRNFEILSASDVLIAGGDWGPADACGGPAGGGNNAIRQYPGGPQPAHITIDGTTIHDIRSSDVDSCHTEGLAIFAGRAIVVRRSRFYGNDVYNFFVQANSGADPIKGLTIENNWFAHTTGEAGAGEGFWSGEVDGLHGDLHVRHNSFNQAMLVTAPGPLKDSDVSGNIGPLGQGACELPGMTYAYNVWQNGRCSGSDIDLAGGPLPYVNAVDDAALDYHLTGGPAVDRVPSSQLTVPTDIDGRPRPFAAAADVGSDERESGTSTSGQGG